jgi:hypothetical protein
MRTLDCSNWLRMLEEMQKKERECCLLFTACNSEGQLGINRIRLMAKMTPHQLSGSGKHGISRAGGDGEWHTVALFLKDKDAVIYDPSFSWKPQSEQIRRFPIEVLVALLKYQNLRGLQLWIGGGGNCRGECNRITQEWVWREVWKFFRNLSVRTRNRQPRTSS